MALRDRAAKSVTALRTPDASLARCPNTVRDAIAETIEDLVRENSELTQLLDEAHSRIPKWATGVNDIFLDRIAAALEKANNP